MKFLRFFQISYWKHKFPKRGSLNAIMKHLPPGSTLYLPPGEYKDNITLTKGVNISAEKTHE